MCVDAVSAEHGLRRVGSSVYVRAEQFLPWHVRELFYHADAPHWIDTSDRFWYWTATRKGSEFVLIDAATGDRRPAFDHGRLADALSAEIGRNCQAEALPFDEVTFVDGECTVEFELDGLRWSCDLESYSCRRRGPAELVTQLSSPDDRRAAFVRDHNLWIRDLVTGEETALTTDGQPDCDYATALPSPLPAAGLAASDYRQRPAVVWSPDGRRLLSHRLDARGTGKLTLVQSLPVNGSVRPEGYTYTYPLPGDDPVPTAHLLLFDVEAGTATPVQVPPLDVLHYGSPLVGRQEQTENKTVWWHPDGLRCYVLRRERGYLSMSLYEIDAASGIGHLLVEETSDTPVDPHITVDGGSNVRVIDDGEHVLWYSQRDGWGHLYLYDARGELLRRLTSGPWAVVDLLHVDELRRLVYFTAVGREAGRDPYSQLLYRASLEGGEPELLTPEEGSHAVSISPTGQFFVSTWSAMETAPVSVLRRTDGSLVTRLEEADLTDLTATGWRCPERFTVKARDDTTDICGILIRPTTFDPNRHYPIVDAIYGGPQANQAPVSSADIISGRHGFWHAQALAELGFVVVMIDGLGMPYRSKAYRDVAYRDPADAGIPDHIHALRQLAEDHRYLDLDRVGIYGHSAGGYASCQAILAYPEFYKVCVSSAGNHDHRLDKAWWVERYMGLPVEDHYREQANPSLAHRLRGKLLLVHGEMDENVHVSSTLVLVDALVRENKDFDFLMVPNGTHALDGNPYFVRRRWDYFIRHLLEAEPPSEYRVTGDGEGTKQLSNGGARR